MEIGQMPDETHLRDRARAAIQSGKLPRQAADSTFGGPGIGKPCAICDNPIPKEQMEIEVLFLRHGPEAAPNTFHVHIWCFAVWEFERMKTGP